MPEEQTKPTPIIPKNDATQPSGAKATSDTGVKAAESGDAADERSAAAERSAALMSEVAARIGEAHNILVALSSDPSVDELAAAIGLSVCLDRIGKRATAIYSGMTPSALEFLKPEKAFETATDTLRDFVIALNKDKADHLRYKLDGDYVRIFITPYRSMISEEDLEYSYGDYNIDLVLALNVANGTDLDSALREHGRIMHDATIINITTANPGKFGEVEWSDKTKSSVSEMVTSLLYSMGKKVSVEAEEATAFLTGIVAATEKFSNGATTAETMAMAAKLMGSGANQQLVAENITDDLGNRMIVFSDKPDTSDATELEIEHDDEEAEGEGDATDGKLHDGETANESDVAHESNTSSEAGAVTVEAPAGISPELAEIQNVAREVAGQVEADAKLAEDNAGVTAGAVLETESVVVPAADGFTMDSPVDSGNKYGKMLEEALEEAKAEATPLATPITSAPGVPEINYGPLPGEDLLPPPPTPPINMQPSNMMPPMSEPQSVVPSAPQVATSPMPMSAPTEQVNPAPQVNPVPPVNPVSPASADPSAFKIPGM